MNTGIFKAIALCIAIALAGCGDVEGLGFLQPPEDGAPVSVKPFTQVEMVQGGVTLVPPAGFCVDPVSVTQTFALLARCDVLGGRNGALDAPLGIMTVSFAKAPNRDALSSATLASSQTSGTVVKQETLAGRTMVQLRGTAPAERFSDVHWRTVDQINGFDVSVALYAPKGSPALSTRGPAIMARVLDGSQSASVAKDVAVRTLRPPTKPKKLF